MRNRHAATLAAAALLALPALAHQPDIPADTPPEYLSECGSCHVAYPAALLSESDWRDIMHGLDKHYGDNASLGEETRKLIFPSGDPPRLTATIWYRVHHHELPDNIFQDKRVGSASNCAACHVEAEKQLFDKTNLTDVPADYGLTEKKTVTQP